jgi:site-specific DNA recombinase
MLTLRAVVYARYSSENQRPESIDDQVSSCKKLAAQRGFTVDESLVFSDEATSGARSDRKGLAAPLAASEAKRFDVVLVDDLSRLARDNYLMLSIMAELHFNGVRVVSVTDGLDTGDEEAKLGIQIRGIFNELQLSDLKKKTLRGQMGQKQRGFIVGRQRSGIDPRPWGPSAWIRPEPPPSQPCTPCFVHKLPDSHRHQKCFDANAWPEPILR